jgi:UDP-glucose 4-epimerase
MMRVLVTGGAGFIGSHIVDDLRSRGDEVVVLDDLSSGSRENLPDDVPLYHVDIRDRDGVARVFDEVRPELVSHQAAQMSVSRSVREPVFDAEVNGIGLLHVLENCVRCEVQRVTFASSGGVLYRARIGRFSGWSDQSLWHYETVGRAVSAVLCS